MDKQSRIYVAGHKGLVGSAIMRALEDAGYTNIVTRSSRELDLRRQADVEAFFSAERPEYVFLAAAKVGGILANSTYVAEFVYDNLIIAVNVINSAYKYGVKKLLNLGSSCIYPRLAPQPLKEEYLLTGPLEPTNEQYALAKIAAIKLCNAYNRQYGTQFVSLMPCNMYGPDDNFDLETSHVLPALVRKFHLAKLLAAGDLDGLRENCRRFDRLTKVDGDPVAGLAKYGIAADTVTLWGTGKPYREFMYVDDLASACLFAMKNLTHEQIGEFANTGSGTDQPIAEIAEVVRRVVGFDGMIEWDSSKPDGMPRKLLDSSRMHALGWQPQVSLEEGIRRVHERVRAG
jgi:GDP-L-fucose synthase